MIKTSGLKRKRFAKGSVEAKEYMAGLRGKKKLRVVKYLNLLWNKLWKVVILNQSLDQSRERITIKLSLY